MKKAILLSALAGLFAVACAEGGPSQAEKDYEKMSNELDSIRKMDDQLMARHGELLAMHNGINTQGVALEDSSILEKLAAHEVMFEEQKATFKKHEDLVNANADFKKKMDGGEEMTDEQMSAKVDEIRDVNKKMMNEQDEIRSELDQIEKDHDRYKEMAMGDHDHGDDMDDDHSHDDGKDHGHSHDDM